MFFRNRHYIFFRWELETQLEEDIKDMEEESFDDEDGVDTFSTQVFFKKNLLKKHDSTMSMILPNTYCIVPPVETVE